MENNPVGTVTEPGNQSRSGAGLIFKTIVEVFETLLIALVLFAAINALTERIRVDGSSMEPTLHHGELILANKLAYRFSEPQIGDVIIFHFPGDTEQEYIKRVIGLPGDKIEIADRKVYINGVLLDEPYINAPTKSVGTWTVSEGNLFVMGDNRNNSSDSRTWGVVPMEYVIGKALMVYWPPEEWGLVAHP